MTASKLQKEWAWSQVEAYIDGSLSRSEMARMRAATQDDATLAAEVEAAARLRQALRGLPMPRARRRLVWRLLSIPGRDRVALRRAAPVAVCAMAIGVAIWVSAPEVPDMDERAAAVQDFAIAMTYLQRSATIAGEELGGAVVLGMNQALEVGRDSMRNDSRENGG